MAGAGDFLGYARWVGSARFARSAADGQAGWAALASLAPPLPHWVFCERQKQKCCSMWTGWTDRHRFQVLGCIPYYVSQQGKRLLYFVKVQIAL